MAKQVKVSLKFEIEEVCLSIFHSSILPMGRPTPLPTYLPPPPPPFSSRSGFATDTEFFGVVSLRSVIGP